MSKNTKEQEIPYSYLVDNIKIFLIFFFKKIQKKKRIKPHSFLIYRKASIFATLIYI